MSDEITPALTPDQWDEVRKHGVGMDSLMAMAFRGDHHALAAAALHGRSFGFTHEDLVLLDEAIQDSHAAEQEFATSGSPENTVPGRLQHLADRIAALLPPNA